MKSWKRGAALGAIAALVLAVTAGPGSATEILNDADGVHQHVTARPGEPGSLDISRHVCGTFIPDPDGDGNFGSEGGGHSSPTGGDQTPGPYPPASTFSAPFGPGGHITPQVNDLTNGDAIDNKWLHEDARPASDADLADNGQPVPPLDPLVFDFGDGSTPNTGPVAQVDYFPTIDHPDLSNDPYGAVLYGLDTPTSPLDPANKGDVTLVFDEGWDVANPDTYVDDFVQRWVFPQPFRYVAVSVVAFVFPDAEIDAVCAPDRLPLPPPPPTGRGQIAPTRTTCEDFATGTADNLDGVFYNVKGNKIGSAAPGVFFYYTEVKAPDESFTVKVTQSESHPTFSTLFSAQNEKNVRVFTDDCDPVSYTLNDINGNVSLTVNNATPGATYFVSVKYSTSAVVGQMVPTNPDSVDYTFTTSVDGAPQIGTSGVTLSKK